MRDWKETLVRPSATIRETLEAIDESALQVALVADGEQQLLGTVTDGDVRRGILRGVDLNDRVEKVMNPSPTTVSADRPREEVLSLMQNERLHQLPVVDGEGRILGLEVVDEFLEPESRENPVVVMAGGLGTRLRPLTEERPKPLVEVGGKPILETILENLTDYGFHRFFFSVNYKAEMVEEHFGDGSDWGVEIEYLNEDKRLGTAGPLRLLPEVPDQPMLVMNGDLLTTLNFAHLLDYHQEHEAAATMCVRRYEIEVPFGVIQTDGKRIVQIREKPNKRCFVNAGVYVLNPRMLDLMSDSGPMTMTELFGMAQEEGERTVVFPLREDWIDVGRPEDLSEARDQYEALFG